MNKANHIVLTTIFVPHVIGELRQNLEAFGHLDETVVWVIADTRTPSECSTVCDAARKSGLDVRFISVGCQDEWGKRVPEFYRRIPYGNETRRNIGYLMALEAGCERLISIDDDNFPIPGEDFVGGHLWTGQHVAGIGCVRDERGYYNICEHLVFDPSRCVFPRGFPFLLRGKNFKNNGIVESRGLTIGATFGLWLGEPDVDATTWLNGALRGISYSGNPLIGLDQNTWSPINTQNTSVSRKWIPAFLCIPMGYDVPGGKIQRYGDIWGGYFLQAIMRGSGENVAFGRPLVDHRRNPHNYLDDLRHEFWGLLLTDWLLDGLKSGFSCSSSRPVERVLELEAFLRETMVPALPRWTPGEVKEFVVSTADTLGVWARACSKLS